MAGKVVHIEVPSGDVDRAVGFYGNVFGWELGPSSMEGFDYRMFQTAEGNKFSLWQGDSNAA